MEQLPLEWADVEDVLGGLGFDLRLMPALDDVSGLPTEGKDLFLVAAVNRVLHFRIFDGDGKVVVDTDERGLTNKARPIEDLRKQLEGLWPPHVPTWSDRGRVITAVTSIVDRTRDLPEFKPAPLKAFLGARGVHFFRIRYAPGEVIMPQGAHTDYAGVLLNGRVEVHRREAQLPGRRSGSAREGPGLEECWNRPGPLLHRIEGWVLARTDRLLGAEEAPPTRRGRLARAVARALRGLLSRPERWGQEPAAPKDEARWRRWRRSVTRRLAGWTQRRSSERRLADPRPPGSAPGEGNGELLAEKTAKDERGNLRPVLDRIMGVTGALWNQPRSATLVARPDRDGGDCELLLIKRKVLLALQEKCEAFRKATTRRFLAEQLPHRMAENRLFRNTFYEDDVADWPALLDLLLDRAAARRSASTGRIHRLLDGGFKDWLAQLPGDDPSPHVRYQILSGLNAVLKRRDLDHKTSPPRGPGDEAEQLADRIDELTENEVIRLNHLVIESAYGDVLRPSGPFVPLHIDDFKAWIATLGDAVAAGKIALRHDSEGEVIYREGDPSESLYLIVSGTVRITRRGPGGEMLINQLQRHGYFGVSCLVEGARHSATVEALTEVNAVVLGREAVRSLCSHPAMERKLRGELARVRSRDSQLTAIDRLPPPDPAEEVASKLLLATNLLRIDMDLCTRCDQCVRACAEAHDGEPRFRRSNPDLRFGRWEVAAACVHCGDAPCQRACPVGAISFVDGGIVQVHRSRCIGCSECVPACPFDVIAMRLPPSLLDVAPQKGEPRVATKCDLCLTVHHDPPCVASCPYGAAARGAPRDLFPEIKSWGELFSSK